MSLKITISQKQKLSLSAHMQQSLELLQMDSIALKERIESELTCNPMLEEAPIISLNLPASHNAEFPWNDDRSSRNNFQELSGKTSEIASSLPDYLLEQLITADIPQDLLHLIQYLILSLDSNGWLKESPEDISQELSLPIEQVHSARKIIQSLDPAGIGASDYKECLLIQAERLRLPPLVFQILESDDCMRYLSDNQISRIAHTLNVSTYQADKAIRQILELNPKPGACFGKSDVIYVIPDANVIVEGSGFSITIGNTSVPRIQISGEYSRMLEESSDPEVKAYLGDCLKRAQSLITGISQRDKTLFLCISEIVRQQPDYFRSSARCLLPMTLNDVASSIHMSVSTVSRAIKDKHIACCHGIIPLNSLFTSKIHQKTSGEDVSSQKVQLLIRKLIDEEDKRYPLSDPEIEKILSCDGYHIARRTISKYRGQLGIPPAPQRRSRK